MKTQYFVLLRHYKALLKTGKTLIHVKETQLSLHCTEHKKCVFNAVI